MRKYLFFNLISLYLSGVFTQNCFAGSRSTLFLQAFVPPSMTTKILESKLNAHQSLWLLSSKMNSRNANETQKFEIIGLNQPGLEAHIKKMMGSDRTIQYEVLINHLKTSVKIDKPIFFKISAN